MRPVLMPPAGQHMLMTGMSFTWTLSGPGWACCTVADNYAEAEATASDISDAPDTPTLGTKRAKPYH
jgi:hypothetical protein